jgi:phosphomevalonate kinase
MVSKVLQCPESERIIAELASENARQNYAFQTLRSLAETDPVVYNMLLKALRSMISNEMLNSLEKSVQVLVESNRSMRSLFRELSTLADVPVEPPSQTRLLDACLNLPGVVIAGIPGAGGFDAIFCITVGETTAVETLWQSWSEVSVLPLLCHPISERKL